MPFLIVGLPRSRTAWIAKAATVHPRSVCYHEPLRWLDRWDDLFTVIWNGRDHAEFVGVSDHGFGFFLPEIMQRRAPRTLIIERPIAEVEASLRHKGIEPGNFCQLLSESLVYEHPRIRRVAYADLENTGVVMNCLEWLMPGLSMDRGRIERLQGKNIQADIAEALKAATARRADIRALMPPDIIERLTA
jgi:hypothetical protein